MKLELGVRFDFHSPIILSIDFLFIDVFPIDFFSFKLLGLRFLVMISLAFFFNFEYLFFFNQSSVFTSSHKIYGFGVSKTFYSSIDL